MNKRVLGVIGFVLFALMFVSFAMADNVTTGTNSSLSTTTNSGSSIDKAYACLSDRTNGNNQMSLQEAVFAMLALGDVNGLKGQVDSQKGNNCWPKDNCKLKETAQGLLAYKRINADTSGIENWLIGKNISSVDLTWYLQIDINNHNVSQCKVSYDGKDNSLKIGADMRVNNGAGSCLSVSANGYWLKVSNSCMDKEFTISCDQDFITNLLYQRNGGSTVFVSSETHSAASLGTTKETVSSKCFANTNICDYEGSLWSAYALSKSGHDATPYLPYLMALADDNNRYFPGAFLYALTGSQDQHSNVVQSQRQSKYWEMTSSPNNRFFDTSLGMLSLQGTNDQELANAQNYLLSIQTDKGCWNNDNIRDTGFILYAGWPKAVSSSGGGSSALCTSANAAYSCARVDLCLQSQGQVLYNFECPNANEFCCSVIAQDQTCSAKKGLVCTSSQRCSGTTESSSDGSCCLGSCQDAVVENTCESTAQGVCKASCDANTEQAVGGVSCGGTIGICCATKVQSSGSLLWLWILLLIVLIAIIALAIVYRDKLRLWLAQRTGKVKTGPVERSGAGGFQSTQFGGPRPRFPPAGAGFMPPRPRPAAGSTQAKPREEMDDTFKKLREMSK